MLVENIGNRAGRFSRRLIVFQIFYVMCFLFLTDFLKLPSFISYLTDIIWLTLLLVMVLQRRRVVYFGVFRNWILVYLLFALITLAVNRQPALLFLWGVRNNFRFYVFFLACVLFLTAEDVERVLKGMMAFYYINLLLCLFQYYALGRHGDMLGGIFGAQEGCNAYLNLFLVIISAFQTLRFIGRKVGFVKCAAVLATACYLAALAELKIFFVEMAVIVVLAVLLTRFSWRKLALIGGSVLLLSLAVSLLYMIFPQWKEFFTLESIYDNITNTGGYTGTGDLNRLSAISRINGLFFGDDLALQLFGYGFGSCEYSSKFEFLTSNFFRAYHRLHYVWLSDAWTYLETGYLGLVLSNGFFVLSFAVGSRIKARTGEDSIAVNLARIISVCCIFMAIYNVSLRVECGYLAYFVVSIPLIVNKERGDTAVSERTTSASTERLSVYIRKQYSGG